ncbi:hypothetical protein RUND412_002427 [Rhizina undulata]
MHHRLLEWIDAAAAREQVTITDNLIYDPSSTACSNALIPSLKIPFLIAAINSRTFAITEQIRSNFGVRDSEVRLYKAVFQEYPSSTVQNSKVL